MLTTLNYVLLMKQMKNVIKKIDKESLRRDKSSEYHREETGEHKN